MRLIITKKEPEGQEGHGCPSLWDWSGRSLISGWPLGWVNLQRSDRTHQVRGQLCAVPQRSSWEITAGGEEDPVWSQNRLSLWEGLLQVAPPAGRRGISRRPAGPQQLVFASAGRTRFTSRRAVTLETPITRKRRRRKSDRSVRTAPPATGQTGPDQSLTDPEKANPCPQAQLGRIPKVGGARDTEGRGHVWGGGSSLGHLVKT